MGADVGAGVDTVEFGVLESAIHKNANRATMPIMSGISSRD